MELLVLAIFFVFCDIPKVLKVLSVIIGIISLPFIFANFKVNSQGSINILIIFCFVVFIVWIAKQFLSLNKI